MKIITDSGALAALCDRLATSAFITVDTEFHREKTYYSKLCLIQVAGEDEAAIIDPLADGLDLGPFLDLMADGAVLKVFHAARQDIEIFYQMTGRVPAPLFDTQVAGMVCGFGDSVSYEKLVNRIVGASLDKASRFTDWARRPLSARQLEYAIGDVTHLRQIYDHMAEALRKTGREEWLAEEMAILTTPRTYALEPDEAWRRLKIRNNDGRFLERLRRLASLREKMAQNNDVPRNRILRDEAILEIAAHPPASHDDLLKLRGLGKGAANGSLGKGILRAIAEAAKTPDSALPALTPNKRPRHVNPAILEMLKVLLKVKCEQDGVAQKLVASVADLERLAVSDKADIRALGGWRKTLFGDDALALKAGKLALAIKGGKIALIPLGAEDRKNTPWGRS